MYLRMRGAVIAMGLACAMGAGTAGAQTLDWFIEAADAQTSRGSMPSLVLATNNDPCISHHDTFQGDLIYTRRTGSGWTSEVVDSAGTVGLYSSLALDTNGYPRIAYYDQTQGDLKYAEWNGAAWSVTTVDGATSNVGQYTSLALTTNGEPRIAYYNVTAQDLKFAGRYGGTWSNESVDVVSNAGRFASLELDATGFPHIAYQYVAGTDIRLLYAWWNGATWSTSIVDSAGQPGYYASLELTTGGLPCIAYRSAVSGDLRYASFDGSAWTSIVVDAVGDNGYWSSLALDAQDQPHISYARMFSAGDWDLKYATYTSGFWQAGNVYTPFDTGHETSIAVATNGQAEIAFLNYQSGQLYYAGKDLYYTLTASAGANGSVTPTAAYLGQGSATSVTVQANAYYHVGSVTINGAPSGTLPPSTNIHVESFNPVQTNLVIDAQFAENRAALGTPHWWLAAYGYTTNQDAAELSDTDQDGHLAWQEAAALTNPLDSNSVLRISIQRAASGEILISWTGSAQRVYGVDTTAVAGVFGAQTSFFSGVSVDNVFTDAAPDASARIYRLRAARP